MTDALFDIEHEPPAPKLSDDARRTIRQAEAIRSGMHPLSLALSPLRLHPDASRVPERTAAADGPRCGSCKFIARYGKHSYLKCMYGDGVRVSHGAGTDLRLWWPGCTDWEEAE